MEHLLKRAAQIGEFFAKVGSEDAVGLVAVDSAGEAELLTELARNMHPGKAIFSVMIVQQGSTMEVSGVPPDHNGPLILILRRGAIPHVKAHPLWSRKVIGTLG